MGVHEIKLMCIP